MDINGAPECETGNEDVSGALSTDAVERESADDRVCKFSAVKVSESVIVDQKSLLNGIRRSKNSASKAALSFDADRRKLKYDFNARTASFARQSSNCLLFTQRRDE